MLFAHWKLLLPLHCPDFLLNWDCCCCCCCYLLPLIPYWHDSFQGMQCNAECDLCSFCTGGIRSSATDFNILFWATSDGRTDSL